MPQGVHAFVQDANDVNRQRGFLDPIENQVPPDRIDHHPVFGTAHLRVFGDGLQCAVERVPVLGKLPFPPMFAA